MNNSFKSALRLAKLYWLSQEKPWAWGLTIAIVCLNISMVYISLRLNLWRKALFDALQVFNQDEFYFQIGVFALLGFAWVFTATYQTYLKQALHIRWRRWLTELFLEQWLTNKRYYHLQLENAHLDNPDQRITEDIDRFTGDSLELSIGILNAIMTLVCFLGILWLMPGHLVEFALLYAVIGTWMTYKIGRKLVSLNFDRQHYEADFRFALVRLRENAEAVALYGGEARERHTLESRFSAIFDNFLTIIQKTKLLGWWTYSYSQVAIIFPYLVVAPRFFAKQILLGDLMQTASAFATVENSLSYLMNSYTSIASWQSVAQRLLEFQETVKIPLNPPFSKGEGLSIQLPNGQVILENISLSLTPGESLLITGETGCGKSTLMRSLAGIWPYRSGSIDLGQGKAMFLPQKPYMPLGTLREAFEYPNPSHEQLLGMMNLMGLEALAGELETTDNWSLRLSLGEQQRVSIARVLLQKPDFVFLDEATSGLDQDSEAKLYRLLRQFLPNLTLVSAGHRESLKALHDRHLELSQFRPLASREA